MDHNQKLERIRLAIQELIDEKRNKKIIQSHDDDAKYQLVLSRLHSELEMLKGGGMLRQSEDSSPSELVASAIEKIGSANEDDDDADDNPVGSRTDEIVRELKKVKRQNFVTHCLLSFMIVLTLVWQVAEVSLLMKVKDGLSHPFRALGGMLTGVLKPPDANGNEANNKEHQHEPSALPSLKISEVPSSALNNEE